MIERRTLLKWVAAVAATFAVPDFSVRFGWFRETWGLRATTASASEVIIGETWLASLDPTERRRLVERVRRLLPSVSTEFDEARVAFEKLRRRDFERGRTVKVDGWILSETEVGMWLTQAQLAARRGPQREK